MKDEKVTYQFDKVDIVQLRTLAQLPPGRRLTPMLNARAFMRGLWLGRLRQRYPLASQRELALRLLKELEDADRRTTRSRFVR